MINDQLQNLFESTFVVGHGQHMPTPDVLQELLDNHPKASVLQADDRLVNAMKDLHLEDDEFTSDYQIRINFRATLRRALQVLRENGVDIRVDISPMRAN